MLDEDEPSIDLTPLIDVIFMLLIFFIMTTTFSRPVLDILLPAASSAEQQRGQQEQILSISADGSIHYEGRQVSKEDLPAVMDERPEARLNLHVDRKTPFEKFVDVVDVAKVKQGGRFVISKQQGSK